MAKNKKHGASVKTLYSVLENLALCSKNTLKGEIGFGRSGVQGRPLQLSSVVTSTLPTNHPDSSSEGLVLATAGFF